MNKRNFFKTLEIIAEGQAEQKIFPETNRLPNLDPSQAKEILNPETENLSGKELIASLRGGIPEECDFCKQPKPPEELEPEEAGQWVCWDCLARWAEQDRKEEEKRTKKDKKK